MIALRNNKDVCVCVIMGKGVCGRGGGLRTGEQCNEIDMTRAWAQSCTVCFRPPTDSIPAFLWSKQILDLMNPCSGARCIIFREDEMHIRIPTSTLVCYASQLL
jgi:hypothetical protein